jgi:hypothetical protein
VDLSKSSDPAGKAKPDKKGQKFVAEINRMGKVIELK